ncbi:MAG: hypothetical protein ACFFG0_12215 [Candidatus Thorarchaeota archaeon]
MSEKVMAKKRFRRFSTFYKIRVEAMVHCPITLIIWRNISHCFECRYLRDIKVDKIRCSYPYPDKKWFWKRQTSRTDKSRDIIGYPKKLKVRTRV